MNQILFIIFTFFSFSLYSQQVDINTPDTAKPTLIIPSQDNWILDFSDEFEFNEVDTLKWNTQVSTKSRAPRPDLGIDDWWWTAENVWQENGNLVLQVSKKDSNTMHCGSVNSDNLYETQYGYFEARIKIADTSKGTHTAFWFQGDNMNIVDSTANDGAEIDVFESAWLGDYTKSVVHIDGYAQNHQANTKRYETPDLHDGKFHIWGFHWTESFMKIYYDGVFKVQYNDHKWIVNSPEFIWLSDGASFGYSGDNFIRESVGVLTHAYVDYVRVWKSHPTSNQDLKIKNKLNLHPNPACNTLTIKGLSAETRIDIYNTSGRLVSNNVIQPNQTLDVSSLQSGMYILKIESENYRFIKN